MCAGLIGYRAWKLVSDVRRLAIYGFGAAAHIVASLPSITSRRCMPSRAQAMRAPDDLVAWNDVRLGIGEFAIDYVQIGAADRAGRDAQQDVPGARAPQRALAALQWRPRALECHGHHASWEAAFRVALFRLFAARHGFRFRHGDEHTRDRAPFERLDRGCRDHNAADASVPSGPRTFLQSGAKGPNSGHISGAWER
jgi:hypothetical protein